MLIGPLTLDGIDIAHIVEMRAGRAHGESQGALASSTITFSASIWIFICSGHWSSVHAGWAGQIHSDFIHLLSSRLPR